MADNVAIVGAVPTYTAAADEAAYSGDTAKIQLTRHVHVTGSEGSKTVNEVYANGSPSASGYGAVTRDAPVADVAHLVAAGSGDATSVKGSAGTLRSVHVFNKADVPVYVKFHNTASAPTPGSGVVLTIGVQAGLHRDVVFPGGGRAFATGIGFSIVTGIANTDSTGVTAGDCVVDAIYE